MYTASELGSYKGGALSGLLGLLYSQTVGGLTVEPRLHKLYIQTRSGLDQAYSIRFTFIQTI